MMEVLITLVSPLCALRSDFNTRVSVEILISSFLIILSLASSRFMDVDDHIYGESTLLDGCNDRLNFGLFRLYRTTTR